MQKTPTDDDERLRLKALRLIEDIAANHSIQQETPEARAWSTVYQLAHVAMGDCTNPHEDWRAMLLAMEAADERPKAHYMTLEEYIRWLQQF